MSRETVAHSEVKVFYRIAQPRRRRKWGGAGRVVIALVVSLAVLLALGCSGEEGNGKIAFVSDRDGDPEIYVMEGDGSDQTSLTNNGALDTEAPVVTGQKMGCVHLRGVRGPGN